MKTIKAYKTLSSYLNAYVRENGGSTFTGFVIGETLAVRHHQRSGYRKHTTGQYVPNAYRANFGWKNTYYQNAEWVVEVPITTYEYFCD